MRQTPTPKKIAILMDHDIGYCRRVMSGILRFAAEHGGWQFRDGPADGRLLAPLARWQPDGIIAHLFDRHLAGGLARIDCPVVSTTDTLPQSTVPRVDVDNREVGREAARYFVKKGFRNFGYYGSGSARFSMEREAGFRAELKKLNLTSASFHAEYLPRPPIEEFWQPASGRLDAWLRALPKPAAVFCSNDLPARRIAEACGRRGMSVPDEVAILGVDNDESECRLSTPALSSIDTPSERIGYQAAEMLAALMKGRKLRRKSVRFPPLHIVARASTDRWASSHPVVIRALDHINREARNGVTVANVAAATGVSRRKLERLFQSELRCTVLAVIHDSKTALAKQLLSHSDYRIAEIADITGFTDIKRLNSIFKKVTGMSPSQYQKIAKA